MKNLLFSFILIGSALFYSCSSNDDKPVIVTPPVQSSLTANVNGTDVVFDAPTVTKEFLTTPEGVPYTDLIVTANKKNDASTKINFRLEHMTSGIETCYYFLYQMSASEFDIENGETFMVDVTENTANKIKGNFSGTLSTFDSNNVTMTNGQFDVTFL